MFNLEIEKKIVDFVKKSTLGVTSSDIANYVGLNRMTITKYLAIIKERALIDFKQFGMAKLWYIPVNLSKESFLSRIMTDITENIPEDKFKELFDKVGISLGEEINLMYVNFYAVDNLNFDRILDTYKDIGEKLGGSFNVNAIPSEKISVKIIESPFAEKNRKAMHKVLSVIFAKIAAINLGYAKALVTEKEDIDVIEVYLRKEDRQKE